MLFHSNIFDIGFLQSCVLFKVGNGTTVPSVLTRVDFFVCNPRALTALPENDIAFENAGLLVSC